ncbi:MAG: ribose 5-phosphate isomerase B [Gemmatimonadaceae bacterium]
MKIGIGSDHAGFRYKELIKTLLAARGHEVKDFGTYTPEMCDYPLFIRPTAEAVASGDVERGIVLGGSGNGEAIVANRVRGVRCTLCWNADSARFGRQHNDSNCLSIGERMVTEQQAEEILDIWLTTEFEGGRHLRRIQEIDEI